LVVSQRSGVFPGAPALRAVVVLLLALALVGCGGSPARELLATAGPDEYATARFGVCKGYGCSTLVMTGFSGREWAGIAAIFDPPPVDAADERTRIAVAIGRIERLVGLKTGTEGDAPGAAIINFDRTGQMDCIDEAFNTTVYLGLLAKAGLLRFHVVGEPARRGHLIDGWPHNSATLIERAGSQAFAVDSWFHGNGHPPEIIPLGQWLDGWSPQQGRAAVAQ